MNTNDQARIMSMLSGAYPHVDVDEDTARVWANSLAVADYDMAAEAANRWIAKSKFWPSIAEFNGEMTQLRREASDDAPPPEMSGPRGLRCDGSGWVPRDGIAEPCPACNPWLRQLWQEGELDNTRKRPPANWIQPPPCRRSHAGEGSIVFDRQQAMRLVLAGLREELANRGYDNADIDEAVRRRMPKVLAVVAGSTNELLSDE